MNRGSFALVIAITVGGLSCENGNKANSEPISISIGALLAEFRDNETAARKKYRHRIIEVEGLVAKNPSNKDGKIEVSLKTPGSSRTSLSCFFSPSMKDKLENLKDGQNIKVRGRLEDVNTITVTVNDDGVTKDLDFRSAIMNDCELLSVGPSSK